MSITRKILLLICPRKDLGRPELNLMIWVLRSFTNVNVNDSNILLIIVIA